MKKQSIAEIKAVFASGNPDEEWLAELQRDERRGVQQLLMQREKQLMKEMEQRVKFKDMCRFEAEQHSNGFQHVAGIDEAGRGPLAGPVVAAAVILPQDFELLGLNDSKQLSEKKRKEYYEIITQEAVAYHIAAIDHTVIDQINIYEATKQAMHEAIAALNPAADCCLIDAVRLDGLPCPSASITKGDELSVSIAAASILAKTYRDDLMKELHERYPQYDFASNMGYGTKSHLQKLEEYGPSPYHRKSFAPVRNIIHTY